MPLYSSLGYNIDQDIDIETIKGIQFSLLSPDEIIKRSVCEVTKTDTYAGNEPVVNGLFDIRMGALELNRLCGTCGLKASLCPNHMGHIVLETPLYHIMFYDITRKLLKCMCFHCSKLIVSEDTTDKNFKEEIIRIKNIKNNQKRFDAYLKFITSIQSKYKNNGLCGFDGCTGCDNRLHYNVKKTPFKLHLEYITEDKTKTEIEITAEQVLKVFKRLSDKDIELLGFHPIWSRPEWLLCTVLPVPPPAVRPSIIEENGQRREDDLTHKLCDIVKFNQFYKEKKDKDKNMDILKNSALILQYHVFTLLNNSIPGITASLQRNGRKMKSVSDRMKKKDGRIRGNLNAKRVDQSARSVITPDPYISIDQLGIPIKVAMNLTFPEIVNSYNIERVKELILNGPDKWPGAKYIHKTNKNNITINIKYCNLGEIADKLEYGDVVHRHIQDDDYVLFNRQPSLHKMSMMCHRAKVMPFKTFRLNVLDTPPYNADFDGDEMNMHLPQTVQTMNELKDLAYIPYMIISQKDGIPIIGMVQDVLLGSYRISDDKVRIDAKAVANLQMVNSMFSGNLPSNTKIYTGKEVYSMILPPNMNTKVKKFEVINSVIKAGKLDKHSFKSLSSGLIPLIYHDYGPTACRNFLDNTQRLICRWLMLDGFSVGLSDLMMEEEHKINVKEVIKKNKDEAIKLLDDFRSGQLRNDTIYDNEMFIENKLINVVNKLNKDVENICMKTLNDDTNRMINMVNSGSKGKNSNVTQIMGCVAQIKVEGKRIPYGFTGRTLPHYTKYDDGPEARGFVENGFIEGLTPQEVFFHAMGGREGLIDTAVKSVTGDTPIIIIENGETKYINIGEWIDSKIDNPDNKSNIEYYGADQANMELLKLNEQVFIPTCDEDGKSTWSILTTVTRHDPGEILHKINTRSGREVIVTSSKSMLVLRNDKYVEVSPKDMKVGDIVPTILDMPKPPIEISYIEMNKYFPKNEYIYGTDFHKAKQLMDNAMEGRSKIPPKWWENNNGKEFTLPYPLKARFQRVNSGRSTVENIKVGYFYPYGASREHGHMPEYFKLNYENGIFIGLYLADGCTHWDSGTISITKEEQGVKDFVKKWFSNQGFKYQERVRETPLGKITQLNGYTRYYCEFFDKIMGHGAPYKHIPNFAYTAPNEFVIGLLNGYFSGDGSIGKNNNISASSASKELMTGIMHLCSRFGIFGKISKSQMIKNNLGTENIKPSYRINICAQWFVKFRDTVSPLINNLKQIKLNNAVINNDHRYYKPLNNTIMDKIISIEPINPEEKYKKVYDVTVPDTLNFNIANNLTVRDTSDTGYIERRLVKSMEDTKVYYDFTVRNATGVIVQFLYGEDGFDGSKVEKQEIPIIKMNTLEMVDNYLLRKEDELSVYMLKTTIDKIKKSTYDKLNKLFEEIVNDKTEIINKVFDGCMKTDILYCIPFERILIDAKTKLENANVKRRKTDLDPEYVLDKIDWIKNNLILDEKASLFFRILVNTYLNPKQMIVHYGFMKTIFDYIIEKITKSFKQSIAHPGEMVGIVAAQTIGEIGTQMTLDSFHVSGTDAAVNATSGVPRLKELLSVSKNIKTPTMFIHLKDDISKIDIPDIDKKDEQLIEEYKRNSINVKNNIEVIRLCDVVYKSEIYWDDNTLTNIEDDKEFVAMYNLFSNEEEDKSNLVLRLLIDKEKMLMYDLKMIDLYTQICINYSKYINCIYSDDNAEQLIMRIKLDVNSPNINTLCQTEDHITILKAIEYNLIYNMLVKGIKGIKKVSLKSITKQEYDNDENIFKSVLRWSLNTDGTNMKMLFKNINVVYQKSYSNDIREIYTTLGIEAARKALILELDNVIGEGAINYRHVSLLVDTMTNRGQLMSIDRHGINRSDVGPLAKCSFEETTDMLVNASIFSEYDQLNGVSANVMLGHKTPCGTGDFDIIIDEDKYINTMKDIIIHKNNITPIIENEEDEDIFINVNIPDISNTDSSKQCFINRFS
jgi:DNA-directed RNA polymerase beta' subunit/intein/homing endonuclease